MFTPKKELGQNFLIDSTISQRMVSALKLTPDETVIEIGPGLGALTKFLVEQLTGPDSLLYAIEIDVRYVERLRTDFLKYLNANVVQANVLDWLPEFTTDKPFKIIGSLPYYITSPIIHAAIKMQRQPETCVFMIQKEVAQKIANKAPDATYMSSFVQSFYNVEYLFTVDRKKFSPVPNVDGGVIRLTKKTDEYISELLLQIDKYEGFLHRCYASPRKMLNKVFKKDELAKISIDGSLRPQNIDAEKWVEVFRVVS
ncbi:MAG: hypothetical protein ACD_22C00100G0026 [uncultured bacterium]|nr:MAG: hypothetical protein ACD_22C00100G0026 [uncultured bacterium]